MDMQITIKAAIALAAVTFVSTFPAHAQIVALGASNTAGTGVGTAQAFPAQLESMLKARGINMSITNAGVATDTTSGMLSRLDSAVPAGTKVVILQFGGNDARKGVRAEDREANIALIESQLTARKIRWLRTDDLVRSAIGAGLTRPNGIDLNVEGHRRVASELVGRVVRVLNTRP